MFSGSNSYLGSNSGRQPPPQQQQQQQYGGFQPNQGFQPQQTGFQPQQTGFQPQLTGYPNPAPLQPNFTGFPLQAQPTGYSQPSQPGFSGGQQQQQFNNAPQQQSFQTGAPPMPQIPHQFQQPQQTQQSQPPPAAAVQQPQATGFAAMADSFRSTATEPPKPRGRRASKAGAKIPSIRLSFITAQDQAKFETLFKSAVGEGQTLSGEKSRDLLLRSKLDGNSLSQIWHVLKYPMYIGFQLMIITGHSQTLRDPDSYIFQNLHQPCTFAILNSSARYYPPYFPIRLRMKFPAWQIS